MGISEWYIGAAADTKPTGIAIGSKCYEHDTRIWYITADGTNWLEMQDIDALVLGTGAAIIGKVGIDQTTPGTTNRVDIGAAIPAGSSIVGKVGIDQTTPGTTNNVAVTGMGEVQASPTANTLLGRLDEIEAAIDEINVLIGEVQASPTENSLLERQKAIETALTAINTLIGEVQASPTENTVLERLKTLESTIVLATGSNAIGKLAANTGVDIGDVDILSIAAGDNNIGNVDVLATKTIQSELLAITAIAAGAQQKSSILALTGIKKAAVFIDHGRTATTAFVGAGTEYRVEVSEKATGNDAWRTLASVVCAITAASEITADGNEAAGESVIDIGATTPALGDIIFWENATIANSEWIKVAAIVAGTSFTCLDDLTNAQTAAQKIYNKAEQFVLNLDVEPFTRMRVVANNNNGSTNAAIVSRVACITEA